MKNFKLKAWSGKRSWAFIWDTLLRRYTDCCRDGPPQATCLNLRLEKLFIITNVPTNFLEWKKNISLYACEYLERITLWLTRIIWSTIRTTWGSHGYFVLVLRECLKHYIWQLYSSPYISLVCVCDTLFRYTVFGLFPANYSDPSHTLSLFQECSVQFRTGYWMRLSGWIIDFCWINLTPRATKKKIQLPQFILGF